MRAKWTNAVPRRDARRLWPNVCAILAMLALVLFLAPLGYAFATHDASVSETTAAPQAQAAPGDSAPDDEDDSALGEGPASAGSAEAEHPTSGDEGASGQADAQAAPSDGASEGSGEKSGESADDGQGHDVSETGAEGAASKSANSPDAEPGQEGDGASGASDKPDAQASQESPDADGENTGEAEAGKVEDPPDMSNSSGSAADGADEAKQSSASEASADAASAKASSGASSKASLKPQDEDDAGNADADDKKEAGDSKQAKSSATLSFAVYLYGADAKAGDFEFQLSAADASGDIRAGDLVEFDGDVLDDGSSYFDLTAKNSAPGDDGSCRIVFPAIGYAGDGDYFYLVQQVAGDDEAVSYDGACFLMRVSVKGGKASEPVCVDLRIEDESLGATDDLAFYNNRGVSLDYASVSVLSGGDVAQSTSVSPEVTKYLNGSTDELQGDDFTFELVDAQSGETIATAHNDAEGKVSFFDDEGLTFTSTGTYEYLIREVNDGQVGVVYDDTAIKLSVKVRQGAEGLEATMNYDRDEPAFHNVEEGTDVRVRKVSREDGQGVAGCTYALWMVADQGDVMIQEAESDEQGYITFADVALLPGMKYYLKEVDAPSGHVLDPYRTAYFSLSKDGTKLVTVEKTAADGWHSALVS